MTSSSYDVTASSPIFGQSVTPPPAPTSTPRQSPKSPKENGSSPRKGHRRISQDISQLMQWQQISRSEPSPRRPTTAHPISARPIAPYPPESSDFNPPLPIVPPPTPIPQTPLQRIRQSARQDLRQEPEPNHLQRPPSRQSARPTVTRTPQEEKAFLALLNRKL